MTKKAAVFPGQGSQFMGMSEDFYTEFQAAKDTFARASQAIDEDMVKLCFEENPRLDLTEFTQPAILCAEMAIVNSIRANHGIEFEYFGGHSLGEYTALVAAGAMRFEDAMQIVKKRGQLMQSAIPQGEGSMAALIMDDLMASDYKEIIETYGAQVANYNSTEQVVISGTKEGVDSAIAELSKSYDQMHIIELNVSAPFHSTLMQSIEKEFEEFLRTYSHNFKIEKSNQVLSNYTGSFHVGEELIKNLGRQISSPVLWMDNMKNLLSKTGAIYEIGPAKPLSRFFLSSGSKIKAITNLRSLEKAFPKDI